MVHAYAIEGLAVQTGDLICTTDGGTEDITGQFWRLIGKLIPGDVDHIVVYVGPGGRCVEAGARGRVITFDIIDHRWDEKRMRRRRGPFADVFYGVAYPLASKDVDPAREAEIREDVAAYCLRQTALKKPYNLNFLNSSTEDAFYCSQLAYKAYLRNGIDLNTGAKAFNIPGTKSIILPQEIWDGCKHRKYL
jgi:hypothetical protein